MNRKKAFSSVVVMYGFFLTVSPGFCNTTTYTNLSNFVASTGANSVATFDDVPAGTSNPISGGVAFTSSGVDNNAVGLSDSFWFAGIGSSPNWLATVTNTPNVLNVTFPTDVTAFGFLFACFACDVLANDAEIHWTLLSESGTTVADGSAVYNFGPGFSYATANFLGVQSSVPFRSVQIVRMSASTQLASGGAWFIDDFRFAQAPPPAVAVAQIVDGGGWNTRFAITNTDRIPVTFTIQFWGDDGGAMLFPILNGTPGVVSGTLAPGASYFAQSPGTSSTLLQGWADVASNGKIGMTAIFQFSIGSPWDSLGSNVATLAGNSILMPFDNTQGNVTAIAIANTNPTQPLTVSMQFETDGGARSNTSIVLQPHGHQAFVVPVMNPAVAGFRGSIQFTAPSSDIAAMGLEFTSTGQFTSLGTFQ